MTLEDLAGIRMYIAGQYYSSLNKDTDMSNRPFSPIIGSKHCSKHYTNWQGLFSHVGILIEGTIV